MKQNYIIIQLNKLNVIGKNLNFLCQQISHGDQFY